MEFTRETTEKVSHHLSDLCSQMVKTVNEAVPSEILREIILDAGAAICDANGNVVAASSIQHLGALGHAVRELNVRKRFPIDGDMVIVFNDPFSGGTRVQDFYAYRTVELPGSQRPWTLVARGSGSDIGGEHFGSYDPKAREVWAEGARISPVILFQNGAIVRDTMVCTVLNSRTPRIMESLLGGLIDSVSQGSDALVETAEEKRLAEASDALLAMGESTARNLLEGVTLADEQVSILLDYQNEALEAEVRLSARLDSGRLHLDFSDSDAQIDGYFNATRGVMLSAVLSNLYNSYDRIPINDGLLKPIEIETVAGTVVQASYPIATSYGPVSTGHAVVEAMSHLLGLDVGKRHFVANLIGPDGQLDEQVRDLLREDERKLEPFPLPMTEI